MTSAREALFIGSAILASALVASRAEALYYDLDFDSPPHTVGLPPTIGAGPPVRETVSSIPFGTPTVVASHGPLVDQPCEFDSSDGIGDQFGLDLDDLPAATEYRLETDVVVTNGAPAAELAFQFDTPETRSIRFLGNGDVSAFVPGILTGVIGTYTLGQIVHLDVTVDLNTDTWTIQLDGSLAHEGSFGGAGALTEVRVSTDLAGPLPLTGAIDDLTITEAFSAVPCNRLGFGDLALNDSWVDGESFTTNGVTINVGPFSETIGPCGAPTSSIDAQIVNNGSACGVGNELMVNNVTVDFDFGDPVRDVVIPYGEYGGAVSLSVNGDCQVVENYADLDGTLLGGVLVSVFDHDVPGQGCGVIRLGGVVNDLAVGGQEFFLDHITYCPDCPDLVITAFDNLAVPDTFYVGDSFVSGAATHQLRNFYPPGPDCTNPNPDGIAFIGNDGDACGGGNEIWLNNINTDVDFGAQLDWLVLHYGEYGGNVNLRVNGDCRNVEDFVELNNDYVGGARIAVVDYGEPGQSCGSLYVIGTIDEFGIGGQELFVDFIRGCPASVVDVPEPEITGGRPSWLRVAQNRPNPVRSQTTLRFDLGRESSVRVTVFDVAGRAMRTLVDRRLSPGTHEVPWDGRNEHGNRLPAGVYFYRVEAEGVSESRRMMLIH